MANGKPSVVYDFVDLDSELLYLSAMLLSQQSDEKAVLYLRWLTWHHFNCVTRAVLLSTGVHVYLSKINTYYRGAIVSFDGPASVCVTKQKYERELKTCSFW